LRELLKKIIRKQERNCREYEEQASQRRKLVRKSEGTCAALGIVADRLRFRGHSHLYARTELKN
jgi:hypothetical protein